MRALKAILTGFVICMMVPQASAWGLTGHRVVAKIAEENISKETRQRIAEILKNESMVMVSNYMDEMRSDSAYKLYKDWHWVTVPNGKTYTETNKNPKGDLVFAIHYCKKILLSDTSEQAKSIYLKFLIHLVGDLHQPLHVGNGLDAGGNSMKIKWFGSYSNLHSIWDSKMIDSKMWSYTELAGNLQREFTASEWIWRGTIENWAEESIPYREQIYNFQGQANLGYDYLYHNWPLVKQQLWKGGIRLAKLLDEIFCKC